MFFCIFTALLKDSHEGAGTSYRLYDLKAFFCPFLKLNDQRKKKRRHSCSCWIRLQSAPTMTERTLLLPSYSCHSTVSVTKLRVKYLEGFDSSELLSSNMAQTQFKSKVCWWAFSPQATLSAHPATIAALLGFHRFRFAGWVLTETWICKYTEEDE